MMIQKSIVTVLLISTWLQSLSLVSALDSGVPAGSDNGFDGVGKLPFQGSQKAEVPQGKTSVSFLNLRRRAGFGLHGLVDGQSLTSKDADSNTGNLLGDIANLRRRGMLAGELLGGDVSSDGAGKAGESGTSVSLISGLRRRASRISEQNGLLGSIDQDDDNNDDETTRASDKNKKSSNERPDSENDKEIQNTDDDNDSNSDKKSKTNKDNTDYKNVNDSEGTDDDTDSSDNNNQQLERRSGATPSRSPRMERARRHHARNNDEDRHIMEDYENLMKEQQERQKQIQEENNELLQKYGDVQQYQPFTGQQYQSNPQFEQGKKSGGSRISLFSLRRRMANGGT
ncbi:hypothetical protein BCR42DRAFT_405326 [Absidia repens]|uniref:Uncharacterized protein n=1 Tax=Absidia repens TaxID=90262 RepID=A0A1X2ITC1_9FUNG|nr:hypothetical protein BCR42DRAFT_405326 [Absidia repens]